MKLRNKKTGEIVEPLGVSVVNGRAFVKFYDEKGTFKFEAHSLAELNEEWEDATEEPKEYWYLDMDGNIRHTINPTMVKYSKEIGNYFSSKEEAEKVVEKLKAWKRLKDRNFRFNLNYSTSGADINHKDVILCRIEAYFDDKWEEENMKAEEDLDLLLGSEE